ncbi:MAG: DM13 domain-containing protein [Anaerolineales bacterium]|nr:MAG: DM13 domain-containing protein [Anaerolineales bacterium]
MRRKNSSPWGYLGIVIVLGIVVAFGWWFFSPAFIDKAVSEPLPTSVVEVSGTPSEAETNPTVEAVEPQAPVENPPVVVADQVLSRGSFYNLAHLSSGEAAVYQLADSTRILRLQNFSVDNGPDLYVYLVPVDPVPNASGSEIPGYYSLGRLKGNIGDQNYELPADLDLSQYKSVVIWCQAFAVPFAAAPLNPP